MPSRLSSMTLSLKALPGNLGHIQIRKLLLICADQAAIWCRSHLQLTRLWCGTTYPVRTQLAKANFTTNVLINLIAPRHPC